MFEQPNARGLGATKAVQCVHENSWKLTTEANNAFKSIYTTRCVETLKFAKSLKMIAAKGHRYSSSAENIWLGTTDFLNWLIKYSFCTYKTRELQSYLPKI